MRAIVSERIVANRQSMLGSATAIPQCLLGGFFFFLPKAIRCVWTPQIADLKFNDVALTARSFQFALGIKWNQGWRDREFVLKLYLIDDGFIWIKRDYWRVKRNNYIFILLFYLIMDIPEFTIMAVHVSIDQRHFSWDYASLACRCEENIVRVNIACTCG